jgi:hypothetical protein
VYKYRNQYYSVFTGWRFRKGKVVFDNTRPIGYSWNNYSVSDPLYNPLMVGKTSGFAKFSIAKKLCGDLSYFEDTLVILRVILGGTILQGTTKNIHTDLIPEDEVTYAGTEVIDFEEV